MKMLTTTEVISNLNLINTTRFPFVANEYFNCEVNSFLDKFFDAPEEEEDSHITEASK
jgi:hypothetical protein